MEVNKFSNVLEGPFLQYVFDLLRANVLRDRQTMSLVLLKEETKNLSFIKDVKVKLQEFMRDQDVLFATAQPNEIGILLPHSGAVEASGFLQRLEENCKHFKIVENESVFQAVIVEIFHPELTLEGALAICRNEMVETNGMKNDCIHVIHAHSGFDKPVTTVKVSILDDDKLFRDFLTMAIERVELKEVNLQIRDFEDGLSLLQTDWVNSWHPHLVIMSDILPKKNGLDVLHTLRAMANEEKFTILMMTRRNTEEDMIYAYESGTDGYLVKPFNLRLFEAQVKRLLGGIWS